MTVCHLCGVPPDSGVFDESSVGRAPKPGEEIVLARYDLHRNHCGLLMYFAQFTDQHAKDPSCVDTPALGWEIRINGAPRAPYREMDRIVNPWGLNGFPVNVRLEEGSIVEFVVRGKSKDQDAAGGVARKKGEKPKPDLGTVGGRLVGRYWYNTAYGGAPNPL